MKLKEKEVKVEDRYVRWFSDLSKKDVKIAGGKAANLGEMLKIGMPVPQGFVIMASSYNYFLEETGLKEKIYEMLKIDVEDTGKLEETAGKIKEMIENAEMPKEMEEEIIEAYEVLSFDDSGLQNATEDVLSILRMGKETRFVAVRSSATAEDSEKASFAGQQETFLNVKGRTALIDSIKKCFASLFTARSIYYRIKKGFRHEDVLIAVAIQIMINSDKSGVIFSRDPIENPENIVIEAVFGLGEGIVSGRIQPDHYTVNRDLKILKKKIAEKKIAVIRDSAGETKIVNLTEERSNQQVLSDYEVKRLADYSLKLEEHYKIAQDIEFAISSGEIYIVQTRPVTTLGKKREEKEIEGKLLIEGLPASPGIGSGEVKIILDLKDLNKIRKGDVLVTKMTNPDMVVSMQKCSAIVTDEGGVTAHAAIVSREMGIPCIVGTGKATKILKDYQLVTVDGFKGGVYEGRIEELQGKKVEIKPIVKTETKIKVMVDLPDFAERAAKTNCKEVGLLRLEGIIAESGKHPFYFSENKKIREYEEMIFRGIKKISEFFDELWIRTSDIRSDEFRNLEGSGKDIELNPMLGMHGIRAGLKYKEILISELKAIARLAEEKKVGIMMPQIISVEEVREVKKILNEFNVDLDKLNGNIKLGVMIETPAAVQIIENLCLEGIDFISFGTNDLTQYTLAVDRGNEDVQYLYDEMHPAVLSQLADVISACRKYKVETSICGQAGSKKEMVEFLVKEGIDSISVNADKAYEISKLVRELEEKGLKESELEEEKEIEGEKTDEREIKESEEKIKDIKESREKENKEKVKETMEEAIDEIKEKAEELEKIEEWQDLDFGIDVFSSQQESEEKEAEGKEEEREDAENRQKEESEKKKEEEKEQERQEENKNFYEEGSEEIIEGEQFHEEKNGKETTSEIVRDGGEESREKEKEEGGKEEVLDIF